ncbi:phage portal protein [uncultured Corynebacterium sp.]|uniref:phage portal protein n=1 Tax=uncultured Corynebacterium sp. TaxID=159447 RepID=UPI0025F0932F|nr:phage portal protein [uncultured Corynebacterium sp.]
MDAMQIKQIFDRLHAKLVRQQRECDAVDSWLRPELEAGFEVPRKATREHRALRDLSRTPWLKLVVDNVVQAMYVDSIVGDEGRIPQLWDLWNANGMRSQQISNHRAMVAYGHSYAVVTGAQRYGERSARIRFLSPRRVAVEFEDLGADPFPSAALELEGRRGDVTRYRLRVPGWEILLEDGKSTGADMDGLVVSGQARVDLPYVPVVRFANQLDLDGRVIGEVEPFIPSAQRINKTAYDRMLAQHFNSWKVKTATGLDMPEVLDEDGDGTGVVDEAKADELKLKLDQADILTGGHDVTFGTLDATALDPFVNGWRADIEALAAVSQTPAHALTGMIVNLSAEALAAARAPLTQKVYERQQNASASYANVMRVAAKLAGHDELSQNDMIRVTWQDMEVRSMAQAVDALGKAAQMLRIPARGLWGMIPTVEASDVQEWERLSDEELERDPLAASFARQAESTISDVNNGG